MLYYYHGTIKIFFKKSEFIKKGGKFIVPFPKPHIK